MNTETLEFAITVHQPWAWALASGHKPVENRTWRPGLEHVGKLIGIHASARQHEDFAGLGPHSAVAKMLNATGVIGRPERLDFGALIGVARLVGVVRKAKIPLHPSMGRTIDFMRLRGRAEGIADPLSSDECDRIRPWWRGPWGWLFEEAVLLPEPIPMRGQQGLWRIRGCTGYDGGPPDLSGLTSNRYHDAWALEQWRKAREEKR